MKNQDLKIGCINTECPDYQKIGLGNIIVRREVGKNKIKMLKCKTCKKEFSERNGTPLFGLKSDPSKIEDVLKHIGEGCGIRATHRLTGINKNTVMTLIKKFGSHSEDIHNKYIKDIEPYEVQLDEKWSFVGKKDKNNIEDDKKKGHNGIM